MSSSSSSSQDYSWSSASISLVAMTWAVFLVCSYHLIFKLILEAFPVWTLSAPRRLSEDPIPSSRQFQIFLGGLRSSLLKILPITQYAKGEEVKAAECVVCLEEFDKGEWLRNFPDRGHRFHVACIDACFRGHSSCPLCRTGVGSRTTSVETPSREGFVQGRAICLTKIGVSKYCIA